MKSCTDQALRPSVLRHTVLKQPVLRHTFSLVLLVLIPILWGLTSYSQLRKVTLVVLRDFPPLYKTLEGGHVDGFAIRIWNEIAKKNKIQTQYLVVENWEQGAKALREGRGDVFVGVALTPQWEKDFLFSDSILRTEVSCFVLSSFAKLKECEQLNNFKVAVIQKGAAHQYLEKQFDTKLIPVFNLEEGIVKLLSKEADVFIAPKGTVIEKLQELKMEQQILPLNKPLMELTRVILVRKELKDLFSTINTALQEILNSHVYQKLLEESYGTRKNHSFVSDFSDYLVFGFGFLIFLFLLWVLWNLRFLKIFFNIKNKMLFQLFFLFVLLIFIIATFFIWRLSVISDENKMLDFLESKVEEAELTIQHRIHEYEQVMRGALGLFLASDEVTLQEWKMYVEALHLKEQWKEIQGLGFAKVQIIDQKSQKKSCPVIFVEPLDENNQELLKSDLYDNPTFKVAMDQARDVGRIIISNKLYFSQDFNKDDQTGFLMILPYYKKGMPINTLEERRSALIGFIFSSFRTKEWLNSVFSPITSPLDIKIYDGSDETERALLYSTFEERKALKFGRTSDSSFQLNFSVQKKLILPGSVWTMRFQNRPETIIGHQSPLSKLILLFGFFLGFMFCASLLILMRKQNHLQQKYKNSLLLSQQSEALLHDISEQIQETLFRTDPDGILTFLSKKWESLTSYSVSESLGKLFVQYLGPSYHHIFLNNLKDLESGNIQDKNNQMTVISKMEVIKKVDIYFCRQLNLNGSYSGIFGIIRDVSSEKDKEEALSKALNLVVSTKRVKTEFLTNVTVELRNPINYIIEQCRVLFDDKTLKIDQIQAIKRIFYQAVSLQNLINDILGFSKLESELVELNKTSGSFEDLIKQLNSEYKPQVQAKGIQWRTTVSEDLPQRLFIDWEKVEDALRHLLSNAIKFTESGYIAVYFHRPSSDLKDEFFQKKLHLKPIPLISISVTDSGIGITENKLKIIFEDFQKIDPEIPRRYSGSGLGLAVAQRYAHLLGGMVHVRSRLGSGSTFTLTFPEEKN